MKKELVFLPLLYFMRQIYTKYCNELKVKNPSMSQHMKVINLILKLFFILSNVHQLSFKFVQYLVSNKFIIQVVSYFLYTVGISCTIKLTQLDLWKSTENIFGQELFQTTHDVVDSLLQNRPDYFSFFIFLIII